MPAAETYRTFVALPLSPALHDRLTRLQQELIRTCPPQSVKWVKPEGIHLTLFFLGEIPRPQVEPIQAALEKVAAAAQPFTFAAKGTGTFPNLHRPRVIWAGLDEPTGQLRRLHAAVSAALSALGYQPEEREFSPHLTLGRVDRDVPPQALERIGAAVQKVQATDLGTEPAAELTFFRSQLKPAGAEYTPLATFRLGA
jgi:2'-5' RNA ligase